jgi:hypothetical protein
MLSAEYQNGQSWAATIISTLFQIAVTPDEYTEDASVSAARLIWEIVGNKKNEVH